MKGGSLRKRFLITAGLLSIFPALIIFLFLPPFGSKYKLQVEPVDKFQAVNVYEDLNSDSISEVMRSGIGIPYYHILVQDNDYHIYNQWNFQDSLNTEMCDFFFGNYDSDRYKEIYCFTYREDSLFLNINEFFDPVGTHIDRLYITKIRVVNKIITSVVYPAGFYDLTGDGICEFYFTIQTGFGVEPRRLYCYDILKKELRTSELTGVMCSNPKMLDSDGDNKPEIFGLMSASDNYKTRVPYSDKSTWLMIFNEKLKLEFPPVEFPGFTNILEIEAYKNNTFRGYVVTHNTASADSTVPKPRIMIFNLEGKMIRERLYSDLDLNSYSRLTVLKYMNVDRIYILGSKLMEFNSDLAVINSSDSPFRFSFNYYKEDINFDGIQEFILFSANERKLVIYSASLQKMAEADIMATNYIQKFSHYNSSSHEKKLFMQAGDFGYFLKLQRNTNYYLGYILYPGSYLMCFFFIQFIMRIGTHQIEQRENLKQRLLTLQLQGIKSQFDPHFTFNTLNSVASLIYLEDRQTAYDYMNKFTQLLRAMLNDAEKIYRRLGEEIEFVNTYLELEKLRFGDRFNYKIEVAEGVSMNTRVPKLVLHTFAENAIKHGIMPRPEGGFLNVNVEADNDNIKLTIEDNGIGRDMAAGQSTSTGRGLKLTSEFYDILNQINKKPVRYTITDLYNISNDPSGTRVEVWVPVE